MGIRLVSPVSVGRGEIIPAGYYETNPLPEGVPLPKSARLDEAPPPKKEKETEAQTLLDLTPPPDGKTPKKASGK